MSALTQQSNSPGINFGQLDEQNVTDGTSVNLFQGNLSMPLEVISLPGLNDLNCDINLIYQSQVTEIVDRWNLEDLSSYIGIGWDLSIPRIVKEEKSNSSSFDDIFYLIEQGNPTRLIPNSKPSSDQIEYELENYQFHCITYFPKLEKWEIKKEDGTVYIYGGQEDENTLQWGIKWGNWIGSSLITENQERYVKAWNLSKVENIYGNFYSLSYKVKEQSVGAGTLTYTKECMVNQIKNDLGWYLNFNYQPKTYDNTSLESPKEYLDPYRDPQLEMTDITFFDAFQSCYISMYLESVSLSNQNNQFVTTVQFHYYDLINLTPSLPKDATVRQRLNYGATYKRYLKSIERHYPNGESKPGTQFIYNFTTQPDEPRGALEKIIYSSGGQSIFNYKKILVGANDQEDPGSRNRSIPNPFGQTQPAKPRIWYGQDYTISAWYNEDENELRLNVFTWVGHWCISQTEWWTFEGIIDLDKLQLAISDNCFCLAIPYTSTSYRTDLFLFNRDHLKPTVWTQQTQISSFDTTNLKITNGQNFFLVYDSSNKILSRYFWHPFKRFFITDNLPISTDSDDHYFMTAYSNYYIIYRYNTSDDGLNQFTIYYLDDLYNWQKGGSLSDTIYVPSISSSRYCEFGPSDSFAAVASIIKKRDVNFDSELKILMWNADFTDLRFADLEEPWDERSPFTYIPMQILPYLGPMAIQNSVVASGPNTYIFNGKEWNFQTVGIENNGSFSHPEDQFYWYAFEQSGLLKTENTASGILSYLRYPDQENNWNEIPIISEYAESSQSKRVKEAYPTLVNNYLTADKYIYSNPFNQDWQNLEKYLIAELEIEDDLIIDTTTLINQAPHFIAFMTVDQEGQPHDTRIGFFHNGDLIRKADGQLDLEILTNQQITKLLNKNYEYSTSLNGQLPAIAEGFVTYSTDTDLDASKAIVLHHYANKSLQDPIETFVINQMISDSGYNKVSKCYEYQSVSAAQDSTQTLIRFQKVIEYQGCIEPENQLNGYTISYFANGIPDQQNEVSIPSALDGVLLKKEQYDSLDNLISFTETESEILTQIPKSWTSSSFRPLFGAFLQTKSKTTMLDGVTTRVDFTYFSNTGRVRQTEMRYWNSQGQEITEQNIFTYGCEQYEVLKQQNRLAEVVQMQIQTKTNSQEDYQINYNKVQTYKSWIYENQIYWAEFQEYFANNATAIFDWTSENISEEDWQCTKTIIQRDEQGNVVECEDTEKIITTLQYDDIGRFPVASFRNASSQSEGFFYESFEPYQTCSISFNEHTGGELYQQDCFVGTTCYKINKSGILTKADILPTGRGANIYCLSAYLKTNIKNSSDLKFQFTDGLQSLTKIINPETDWFYFQWIVDLEKLKNTSNPVDIQLIVSLDISTQEYIQIDQFSFRPINTQFSAEIYDEAFGRQTASLANNGACERILYNQFQDQQSMIGAYGNVLGFRTAFLTRQLASQGDTSFSTENPNMEMIIRGQESGFYDTFKENALSQYNYIDSSPEDWCVDQNKLQFLSAAEDKILGAQVEQKFFKSNNLAVCVYAPAISAKSISLGIGNFYILWNDQWNLVQQQDDQVNILEENKLIPFGREWVFISVKNRLAFFANGSKIFDWTLAQTEQQEGTIKLGMQNSGSFEKLIVADQIEMDINYMDGFGNIIQTFRWESSQSAIVEGTVYDSCGRAAIQLKSTRVTNSSLNYLNNWVELDDENLWKGEGIQGDINQYHPDDQGYPFEQEGYEASPLERVIKKGLPGKPFAITPTGSHIQTIEYGTNPETTDFKYTLPENGYFLQTLTDADGARTYYYRDIAQHLIGVVQEGIGGNRYASWTYNKNGDLIEAIPPNYYSGDMDASGISTYIYNFLGRQTQSSHPDSGEGRFVYDDASMVRIYQDAQMQTDNLVNYLKYDSLGRLIEKGYLEQDWDLPTLETYAKNPNWPLNGNWIIRYKYDGDDSTPNMLGNLWQTETANNESVIVENFSYDFLNCPITCQRTIDDSLLIELKAIYNCCGVLAKTSDNQTNLEILHYYNSLGQLIKLTSSLNQGIISSTHYSYTASGLIQTLQIQNPELESPFFDRDFTYNSPDWLTNLQDSSFKETLTYNSGSIENTGYYTGKIASQSIQLNETDYGTSNFKVDQWNRLIQSKNSSLEENWEIDLNNNFQSWTSNSITRIFETIENRNQVLSIQQNDQKTNYTYQLNGDIKSISNNEKSTQFAYYKGTSCLQTLECSDTKVQFEYNGENLRATKTLYSESVITDQWFYFYNDNDSGKPRLIIHKNDSTMTPLSLSTHPFVNILSDGEKIYFALKDHLDSTRIILDTVGNICGQYDYTLYGKPNIIQTPPISYNYLFTDHEYDVESGFYNMEIRLYDPTIGRFLMTDPKAEFFSPYVYVGNNPLIATDPTGRMSSKAIGWLALVVGVVASVATAGAADLFLAPAAAAALGVTGAAETALGVGIGVTTSSVVGAFASQAVTAGANHDAFFTKSLGTSLLANIAGGLVGAGVGAGVGSAMKSVSSRVSSKAISGASKEITKKVAKTAVKEVAGNITDSLTNSTVSWAFGDEWNAMDGALIGLSQLGVILPVGKKYRKLKQNQSSPVIGKKISPINDTELPVNSSKSSNGKSTKSHKKTNPSSSPTNTSRLVRSNAMRKRTNPYSSKQTVNLSKSVGKYSKTRTFTKELQTDIVVSPREVLI
uniref:DUF6443 domain-containing protein n=1 Tax=Pseudoderbesia arbuscula TaxID=2320809 RepID=A0A386AYJ5_9CHLO|nr:hypothetical protein [Pseudoderbesia arbuscula]